MPPLIRKNLFRRRLPQFRFANPVNVNNNNNNNMVAPILNNNGLPIQPILPLPAPPQPEPEPEPEEPVPPEPEEPFITLAQDILPHQLDCIVWNHRHNFFVFGSYELDPNNSSIRHGILYIAKLTTENEKGYTIQQEITGLPGILDIKWEPTEEKYLAAATSSRVIVYHLEIRDGNPVLTETLSGVCGDSVALALFVQWMNPTELVTSDSAGFLRIWTITPQQQAEEEADEGEAMETNQLVQIRSVCAHDFFVWFVHYDPVSDVFYSGDDDGTLVAFHSSNFEQKALHFKKKFESGVTAINTRDNLVTVGCYDEKLRIYLRTVDDSDKKIVLSELMMEMNLLGTVWRTIWIPPFSNAPAPAQEDSNVYKMGIAAGNNGIHMISFNRCSWTWDTTLRCLDHRGALAYGIDMKVNEEEQTYDVATCYFTSKTLHVFKMKP